MEGYIYIIIVNGESDMELINYLQDNLNTILVLFARVMGLIIFMPGISSKSINKKIKVLLAFSLSIMISSYTSTPKINDDYYMLILLIIAEFLGGLIIGLISSLFMQSIQIIGALVDNLLGTAVFQTADMSGAISSTSIKLIEYTALLLFFISNSHLYIIYLISMNLNFLNLYNVFTNDGFLTLIINTIEFIFINGLHLAMPFILIFLIIDICLGIINRSFSSFNVFLFSMPIKILLFVAFLFYYLVFFKENFGNFMNINFDLLGNFIRLIK